LAGERRHPSKRIAEIPATAACRSLRSEHRQAADATDSLPSKSVKSKAGPAVGRRKAAPIQAHSRNPRDRGLPLPCGGATSPGRSDVPRMTATAARSKARPTFLHPTPPIMYIIINSQLWLFREAELVGKISSQK